MQLTNKQEVALKNYIIDKIDELEQYLIIHREPVKFIFTKLIDPSLENAMAFIHKIRSEMPKWNLLANHPLVSEALKESNEQKLFDFFNFLRLQGDYCKELKKSENIEFVGDEIAYKIHDIFYQYVTTEINIELPPIQKNRIQNTMEVSQDRKVVTSANIAVRPVVQEQEFDLKSLMSTSAISDDQKSMLEYLVNDADSSTKEKNMAKLILARHTKITERPKVLSKNDLIEIRKETSAQLNFLYGSLVLNAEDIVIQLFQEVINNVLKSIDNLIDDISDMGDDFKITTSSLSRGTGKTIFNIISAFRKNIEKIIATKDETTKAEINKVSAALSLTYTPFGIEDIHPDQNILDWHEWRLRLEQERLHSTSSNIFYDTLSKVKTILNNIKTIKYSYIVCAEHETSYSELSQDVWTCAFIETLTTDLKMAGLNIESSQTCANKLIPTFKRKENINLAKNIFVIGTKALLPSIKKDNSSAFWEIQFALNKAEENVPLIFVLLSGTKAISIPNASHLPQLTFLTNREESNAKALSYIELLKFFIAYTVGSEISKQCNSYWSQLELLSKIPSGGISYNEVIQHLQIKDSHAAKSLASFAVDHRKNEDMKKPVIKISNTNGVLEIKNMKLVGNEKIKLEDSTLSVTLANNRFLLEGIKAAPHQSTRAELNKSSLYENFPIKAVVNVNPGNALFLTGNHPILGEWKEAIRMIYTKDNIWTAQLPHETLGSEFKFLIGSYDIGAIAPVSALIWEDGPNHKLSSTYYHPNLNSFPNRANICR